MDPRVTHFVNGRFLAQRLSGVQRFAGEMAAALVARRPGAVEILAPPDAQGLPAGARAAGRRTGQAWEQLELPGLARGGVLVNLGNTAPLRGRRQLVVIHDAGVFDTPEAYSWKFRAWYKALHFGLSRGGARLATVSVFSQGRLAKHLRVPAERIAVLPEGADHMAALAAEPDVLAAQGLVKDGYVLVVGTLAAHKNLAALGVLAAGLAARGMVLAVTGAFGAAAFAGEGKLPAGAKYMGRVSDGELKALYENAACFVFPSRYEGFGLPAAEAMVCGCAVVAAEIPALREVCGEAATYCDPASPVGIAGAVLALLDDAPRLAAMRAAARARVMGLTWARAAEVLEGVLGSKDFFF